MKTVFTLIAGISIGTLGTISLTEHGTPIPLGLPAKASASVTPLLSPPEPTAPQPDEPPAEPMPSLPRFTFQSWCEEMRTLCQMERMADNDAPVPDFRDLLTETWALSPRPVFNMLEMVPLTSPERKSRDQEMTAACDFFGSVNE